MTNRALRDDFSKTNIHACLAHFMLVSRNDECQPMIIFTYRKDMRKRVNKCLPVELRELGMWSIALLVNTNTWAVMKDNWELVCDVFLNYSSENQFNSKNKHALLLSRIDEITSNPNVCSAIEKSKMATSSSTETNRNDVYDFDDQHEEDDNDHLINEEHRRSQPNQMISMNNNKRKVSKSTAIDPHKNRKV